MRTVKLSKSRGVSLVEYALLISFIILGALALISKLGSNVSCTFTMIRLQVSSRICASEYNRCIVPNCTFGLPGPCDLDGNGTYNGADSFLINNKFDGSC